MNYLSGFFSVLPEIIAAASAIAAVTPSPKDNNVLAFLKGIVNLCALNFGQAENRK